jgi:NADH-quinone oxidoreductase subunit F
MSKNLSDLSGRHGLDFNLFEELGIVAKDSKTPDPEAIEQLRDDFLVGKANLYGSISFYDFLRPENQGKKVYICNGSACLTAGTQEDLKKDLLKYYNEDEIGEMCCLGRCHENRSFHVGGRNFSGNDVDNIEKIKMNGTLTKEHYHVGSSGAAILTTPYGPLSDFYEIMQNCLQRDPVELLDELKASGLRGRGGAGFAMSFKLDSCRAQKDEVKFIVCNADEGDPGAYTDRYIMEQRPHALLMGMMIAGYITGAKHGVVYIRAEYPESVNTIQREVEVLRQDGWLGKNIKGTGFDFEFKIIKAQGAYICGEETALLSSIEGQRPEVRVRPPYPAVKGLFNKPTVVNNVETLACVPWIMKNGGKAFAAIGTPKSSGTKLLSLDGYFNRPGVYEVDMGTPLRTVVDELAQGFKSPVKALHIGGPLGGLVPVHKIDSLTVDFDSFAKEGFLLGHASVICIPNDYPLIEYLEHLFRFTAHESCGKCFPCRIGSTRGYEMIEKARTSAYKMDLTLMNDLLETMETGSLCALGGGVPLPIKNALQYFKEELSPYFIA